MTKSKKPGFLTVDNLPAEIRGQVLQFKTADETAPLANFVENATVQKGKDELISNTFPMIEVVSRFLRDNRKALPVAESGSKIKVTKPYSEKVNGLVYEGVQEITPAIITRGDVDYHAWPGIREEKVEKAIIRLASSGSIVALSTKMGERYAVLFSLNELRKELHRVNQSMDLNVIKESLEVLAGARLRNRYKSPNGDEADLQTSYLDAIYFTGPVKDNNVKCAAVLNIVLCSKIETNEYKNFLYQKSESFTKPLSRWMATRLYTNFRYASEGHSYHFMLLPMMYRYGSVIDDQEVTKNKLIALRRDMTTTMREFEKSGLISKYICEKRDDDYYYELWPSEQFVEDIIRLNKISKTIAAKAEAAEAAEAAKQLDSPES